MHTTRQIFYLSPVRGAEQQVSSRHTVYYGLTYTYPAALYNDEPALAAALANEERAVQELVNNLAVNQEAGSTFERYEVFSPAGDQVMVMWRVPVHRKGVPARVRRTRGLVLS